MKSSIFIFFLNICVAFQPIKFSQWHRLQPTINHKFKDPNTIIYAVPADSESFGVKGGLTDQDDEEKEALRLAYELLDCLTSTKDEDSPEYNMENDLRRDRVLMENDYGDLKMELKQRGLSTAGDKQEMMIRLLLSIIDPTINFQELSGREATLQFVNDDDLKDNTKLIVVPEELRETSTIDDRPDADDMQQFVNRGNKEGKSRRVIMDGLSRQEVQFKPLRIRRSEKASRVQDQDITIGAYVSGGRDVLRTWERDAMVVVVLPDKDLGGWRSKAMRVLADEIAFLIQAIVLVPNIRTSDGVSSADNDESKALTFDDIVSAMDYARYQYACKSVCLAGIGSGATLALSASSDLIDIGYMLAAKDKSLITVNGSALAVDRVKIDPAIVQMDRIGTGGDDGRGLGGLSGDGTLMPVGGSPVDGIGITTGSEEEQWMQALRELSDRYDREDKEQFLKDNPEAALQEEAAREKHDRIQDAATQAREDGLTDAEILNAIGQADAKQSKQEAEMAAAAELRQNQKEEAKAQAVAAATENVVIANEKSALRAFKGKFLHQKAELSVRQILNLLPKAVLAVCPDGLDGTEETLRVPTYIVLGCGTAEKYKIDAKGLLSTLQRRRDEFVDFSISVYEPLSKYSFAPATASGVSGIIGDDQELQNKARLDALSLGSIWLEIYSRHDKNERTMGTGLNKFGTDAFMMISNEDLADMSPRSSAVTAELHDDPDLFRNNRIILKKPQDEGEGADDGDVDIARSIIERTNAME